jgi:hypothetical protein
MGAVLEMMRTYLTGAAVAAALALTACAPAPSDEPDNPLLSDREAQVVSLIGQARRVVGGIGSDDRVSGARSVPGGFSPEAIAAEPGAYRLIQINALGVQEPGRIIQENGPEVTIALQSGPTAAYDNGVLVATRGFGDDLYAIDSRGVVEALRAGGGAVTRRMERLTSQDQVVTRASPARSARWGAKPSTSACARRPAPLRRKLPRPVGDLRQHLLARRRRQHRRLAPVRVPHCCIFAQQSALNRQGPGKGGTSALSQGDDEATPSSTLCYQLE